MKLVLLMVDFAFVFILFSFFINQDCEEGYFGKNCSLVCSPNCKTCRHTDGFCTCKKGWMGYNCTKGTSVYHPSILEKTLL